MSTLCMCDWQLQHDQDEPEEALTHMMQNSVVFLRDAH